MRDFDKLPLLTPYEAFERAWEEGGPAHPAFEHGYRVRDLSAWKAIETLLRQNDVPDITVASFGLRHFDEIVSACIMLRNRGWRLWQTSTNSYADGEKRAVQAVRAHYRGY